MVASELDEFEAAIQIALQPEVDRAHCGLFEIRKHIYRVGSESLESPQMAHGRSRGPKGARTVRRQSRALAIMNTKAPTPLGLSHWTVLRRGPFWRLPKADGD